MIVSKSSLELTGETLLIFTHVKFPNQILKQRQKKKIERFVLSNVLSVTCSLLIRQDQ